MLDIVTHINAEGYIDSSYHHKQLQEALVNLAGTKARIRIEPAKRTLNQNAYLHAIFSNVSDFMYEAGVRDHQGEKINAEAWKIYFKRKHGLKKTVELPDGEVEEVEVSTAAYNRQQLNNFVELIRHDDLILESGIYIMTPQEFKGR